MTAVRERARFWGGILAVLCVCAALWGVAHAQTEAAGDAAHQQVRAIVPTLLDSEAEHVMGAYVPGMGAMLTLDLIRGPNTVPDVPPERGTRDWAIYLLQTFGPQLNAVGADETIAVSVDFFDYATNTFRHITVSSRAQDVANPATYQIALDGGAYVERATDVPARDAPQPTAAPQSTAAPAADATAQASGATPPTTQTDVATTSPAPNATAQPTFAGNAALDFADPAQAAQWQTTGGQWSVRDGVYDQTTLGQFDLLSVFPDKIEGDYRMEVRMKFVEGEMGGGIIFNAPSSTSKQGAQMISYTGKGTYLQWGAYDSSGVFAFQGGATVATGADGAWHTLAVRVTGNTYNVSLDGTALAQNVQLNRASSGYVGLLASTSHVQFDDLKIEQVQP